MNSRSSTQQSPKNETAVCTSSVSDRIVLGCAILLALVFLASGLSKILWCHHFERVLYEFRLGLPSAYYKLIRAYLPPAEMALAVTLLIPRTRVAALYTTLGLVSMFIALNVFTVLRGVSARCGCFGPYLDGTIGILTVLRNCSLMCVCCAGILLRKDKARLSVHILPIALIGGFCLAQTVGCSRHSKNAQPTANASNIVQASVCHGALPVPSGASVGSGLASMTKMPVTDNVLKGIDDFSAALGLQYARFSYDTNRYLAAYTNMIVRLSHEEFCDFLLDFMKARAHACTAEELELIRLLCRERLSSIIAQYEERNLDYTTAVCEGLYWTYHRKGDCQGLVDCTKDLLNLLKNKLGPTEAITSGQKCLNSALSYYSMLSPSAEQNGTMSELLDGLIRDPACEDYQRIQLRVDRAGLVYLADPEKAVAAYADVLRDWPDTYKNKGLYRYTKCVYEGLLQGLRGDALQHYTMNRYRSHQ